MKTNITPVIAAAAGLLAITLTCSSVSAETNKTVAQQAPLETLLTGKPGFYPACQRPPVPAGKENFQKKHLTLSGLQGVYLDVDGLIKSAGQKNVKMIEKLKERISQRLAKGGLKLLSKEEMKLTPGQPEMNIYMNFPPHLTPAKAGKKPAPYRPNCCTMGIWASFSQAAQILRDPETNYKLSTWGKGHNTNDCSNPAGWMSQIILKTVDSFVAEKLKGDQDYAKWRKTKPQTTAAKSSQLQQHTADTRTIRQPAPPQPVSVTLTPPPAIPTHCNGAVRTYIDMFTTNQVQIDSANYHVLDELAASMHTCPMFNYVIETHADPRASYSYNERLSTLRAASIQGYLLHRGVPKHRFIVQSYGELKPVSTGTGAMDYAANRRVVVRPYLSSPAN